MGDVKHFWPCITLVATHVICITTSCKSKSHIARMFSMSFICNTNTRARQLEKAAMIVQNVNFHAIKHIQKDHQCLFSYNPISITFRVLVEKKRFYITEDNVVIGIYNINKSFIYQK